MPGNILSRLLWKHRIETFSLTPFDRRSFSVGGHDRRSFGIGGYALSLEDSLQTQ